MSVKTVKTYCCDNCQKTTVSQSTNEKGQNWLKFEMKFFAGSERQGDNYKEGHVCGIGCFHDLVLNHKDYLCLNWARVEELHLPR